jgi:predicted transcriptional regulator
MHTTTYSLRPIQSASFTDTARDVIRDIQDMSTQTKARLELLGLIVTIILGVSSALSVFVFLPPRVDALEKAEAETSAKIEAIQAKATASDIAVAEMRADVRAIAAGVLRIESDVRDIRNAK